MTNTQEFPQFATQDILRDTNMSFDLTADEAQLSSIADALAADTVRKLRLKGQFLAAAKQSVKLQATLGATVVRPCVVTLQPVSERIDIKIDRTFVPSKRFSDAEQDMKLDASAPEDQLAEFFDLKDLIVEEISVNLVDFPKASDADFDGFVYTKPGTNAMTDQDASPFGALADMVAGAKGEEDAKN